jgi:hypothetical protein
MTKLTRTAFKSIKDSRFATNGSGNITGTVARAHEEDTADSVIFIEDGIEMVSGVLTMSGTSLKTKVYHSKITTTSSLAVTIDINTQISNALFTIQVDVMSYLAGVTYYAHSVGRGYLFPSGFGISANSLAASGLTIALSYVNNTTVRITITDTASSSNKAGVMRAIITGGI